MLIVNFYSFPQNRNYMINLTEVILKVLAKK